MPLGRKTGGRKAGTPNKATVAMLQHAGLPAGYRPDVPLAKDILIDCMVRARAMVKHYEPKKVPLQSTISGVRACISSG